MLTDYNIKLQLEHNNRIYNVEQILSYRVNKQTYKNEYLIKWLDWDDTYNSWELEDNLSCL